MNKDQKLLAEAYTEGVRKAVKGGVLGAAGGALVGGALGAASGASKGAAATSWVPAIGPLAGVKAASTGVGAALGGLAGAKKGAAIGGAGGATLGALSKDEEDAESVSNDFIKQIERKAGEYRYFIGEADNGRLYAIIVEYDKYSDGDRWIEEVNYYYQIEGEEEGRYISDEKAKGMLKDISISSPDLVDSNKFIFSYL